MSVGGRHMEDGLTVGVDRDLRQSQAARDALSELQCGGFVFLLIFHVLQYYIY